MLFVYIVFVYCKDPIQSLVWPQTLHTPISDPFENTHTSVFDRISNKKIFNNSLSPNRIYKATYYVVHGLLSYLCLLNKYSTGTPRTE